MIRQLRGGLRQAYARWAVVFMLAIASSVAGSAAILSATAPASLALVALLAAFFWALISPETAMVLLLLTLSLGPETVDITHQLAAIPAIQGLLAVVPTGSIAASDVLVGFLLFSALVRFGRGPRAQVEDSTTVGRAFGLYLAIAIITTIFASLAVPFARLGWSSLYLLRLAFSFAPFLILVLMRPSQRWVWAYTALFALLAFVPIARTAAQAWDPVTASLRRYFGLVSAGGFSAMGLGEYLGAAVGLGLAVPVLADSPSRRRAVAPAAVLVLASTLTVVLIQKRAPFVGLLLLLPAWALLPPGRSRRRWLLAGLLIVILVVAAMLRGGIFDRTFLDDPGMLEKLRQLDQREHLPPALAFLADLRIDPNITVRIGQWYRALEASVRYPAGVGYRAMLLGPAGYPHSLYLQILDETSIAGLACFLWLTRSTLRVALTLWKDRDPLSIILGSGLFCGITGMLIQGIFEESLHNWDGMALLWLLAGLAAVQLYHRHEATKPPQAVDAQKEHLAS